MSARVRVRRLRGAWAGYIAVLYPTHSSLMTLGERRIELACWAAEDQRRSSGLAPERANYSPGEGDDT